MTSLVIKSIDSAKEASELVLGQLPVGSIRKVVVILFNETEAITYSNLDEIKSFFEKNQQLPITYRKEYDCFAMIGGAGGRVFSTVMVYAEEAAIQGHTLVADLNKHAGETFPFSGKFTAGPFATMEQAEEYAVKLLVAEGIAIVDPPHDEEPEAWRLNAELDPDGEWFRNRADLLDAWQDCLEGLEWFHIFPALKVPSDVHPSGEQLQPAT